MYIYIMEISYRRFLMCTYKKHLLELYYFGYNRYNISSIDYKH